MKTDPATTLLTDSADSNVMLTRLDRWVASNPWHPRLLPLLVYIAFLFVIDQARPLWLYSYPILYAVQCGVVAWLLWRYRRLTPELTLRFHWLAVVTGLGLLVAWVALGWWSAGQWSVRWAALEHGRLLGRLDPATLGPYAAGAAGSAGGVAPNAAAGEAHYLPRMVAQWPAMGWTAMILRLLGMTLLVPLFEELFTRSAMLRGLIDARQTGLGLVQLAEDLPLLGEWIGQTRLGRRAAAAPPMFTRQLVQTPLGRLTVFGVAASTVIFMANHHPRDWLGCIACGLTWCGLLWWTNRGNLQSHENAATSRGGSRHAGLALGLGPIIWSHAITNAALWAYSLYTGDWQFM